MKSIIYPQKIPVKKVLTFTRRLRTFLMWIPTLSLIAGIFMTLSLYRFLKGQEQAAFRIENSRKAQEISDRIDLSLANSILRVEAYEELMGFSIERTRMAEAFVKSAMPYTVFQRLTIFQEIKKPSDTIHGSELKVLSRVTLPKSTLPAAITDYLVGDDLSEKIEQMKKNSKPTDIYLYEKNRQIRLSVILASKFHKDIFFIFTTPFETLFKEINLNPDDKILISHFNEGPQWYLQMPSKTSHLELIDTSENDPVLLKFSDPQIMRHSTLPVSLRYALATEKKSGIDASHIILITGLLISFLSFFLFYILISQSRRTSLLLAEKTSSLENTAQHLQDALESKMKFLGNVSHEIRTPLNLILGMIDLCLEENLTPKISGYIRGIKSSGEHLLYMIDDLIDLAKSDSNQLQFQEKPIQTFTFFSDIGRLIGQACSRKNLDFYVHLSPSLPHSFFADPNRLRQVLVNLLRNATKYTDKGYVLLRASYIYQDEKNPIGYFQFEVEDSGRGISKDKLDQIFEAFFQVEGATPNSEGGVGLGLSIVKELVDRMNGKVKVESIPGRGSVFVVEVPFKTILQSQWIDIYKHPLDQKAKIFVYSEESHFHKSLESMTLKNEISLERISKEDLLNLQAKVNTTETPSWLLVDYRKADSLQLKIDPQFDKSKILFAGDNKLSGEVNISGCPLLLTDVLQKVGFIPRTKRVIENQDSPKFDALPLTTELKTNLKVLVADDDAGNIELYKAYFNSEKYNCVFVENGEDALNSYFSFNPQVCILDIRMPKLDGIQVLEKIRDHEKENNLANVPVLLITADLVDVHEDNLKPFNNTTLLKKPIRKNHLLGVIQQSCEF